MSWLRVRCASFHTTVATRIAIVIVLLILALAGVGVWASARALTAPFVAQGAAEVQIQNNGFGERVITYRMPNPDDGWQTYVARGLASNGWRLTRDGMQWGGTETIRSLGTYTRTTQLWFVTIRERAELQGDRSTARITVYYVIALHEDE
jgi:hypothetical protein